MVEILGNHPGPAKLSPSRKICRALSHAHAIAEFTVGNLQFLLDPMDGRLAVEVHLAKGDLPKDIEMRTCEALCFITARPFTFDRSVKYERGQELTEFRSSPEPAIGTTLSRPIMIENDPANKATWLLFDKFITHIFNYKEDRLHPISAWLRYVREASGGSIFAHGLALGVAIEGILKAEFPSIGRDKEHHQTEINQVSDWLKSQNLNSRFVSRLQGFFGSLANPRAKDALVRLKDAKYITERQIKAWSDLRNSAAHAMPPQDGELQEWIDDCYTAEVLMYHLIFAAIGYRGEYTDYANGFTKQTYEAPATHPTATLT